jgi:ethanolamine utilization protein EutQ
MKNRAVAMFALLAVSWSGLAAEPPRVALVTMNPVKVTAAAARGPIFSTKTAVKDNGPDGPSTDVLLARSKDGKVESGLYRAGPSEQDIDSYPDDEFMYFIEGGVKLTSVDGTELEVGAGEGVAIPRGWKGHWSTQGYKKYYVTYDSGSSK